MKFHIFKDLEEFNDCPHDYKIFKKKDSIDRFFCTRVCRKCFRFGSVIKRVENFMQLPEMTPELEGRIHKAHMYLQKPLYLDHYRKKYGRELCLLEP